MRPAIKAGLKQSVEAANAYMRQLLECPSILSGHEEYKKKYFETLSQITTLEYSDLILAQVRLAAPRAHRAWARLTARCVGSGHLWE